MREPPSPVNEPQRLAALQQLDILDTDASLEFDRVAQLAADIFKVPIALVSLVDTDRQWFKARVGLNVSQTGRDVSFCGHAILQEGTMVVPDTLQDSRFRDNPLVCEQPEIRFYAGRPLRTPSGYSIGTLCIIDKMPRELTRDQLAILNKLGELLERELAMRAEVMRQRSLNDNKSLVISSLSHELRTPANALLGNLHLLQEQSSTGSEPGILSEAVKAAEHIGRLLGDMVDLAQFEAGLFELEAQPFDLHATVRKLAVKVSERCLERGLDFELQLPDQTSQWLLGNRSRLYQLLSNLVDNALQYTLQGGIKLDVEIRQTSADAAVAKLLFRVRDSGIGIQAGQLDNIFEPFTRGKQARSLAPDGHGLGLTIARKLATLMNGDILARSDGKSGSTLSAELELPLAAPHPDPTSSELLSPGIRLLLVEDSPANRMVIQAMLASEELPVEAAKDGEEALELAASASEQFTIVLMDVDLPGISGIECAQRLRQIPGYAETAIIAISAGMPGIRENALAASFSAYLPKPFQKAALIAELRKFSRP
jgi:signal transduction histidine kinase